jgi:hypothetical protein
MSAVQGGLRSEEIARKWHDLAQRRLVHVTELYRSGRWKEYYANQERFERDMRGAIEAVKVWGGFASSPRR